MNYLRTIFLAAVLWLGSGVASSDVLNKHVLYIGLDGCRDDVFYAVTQSIQGQAQYAHFNQLMQQAFVDHNIVAGGSIDNTIMQPTFSDPGWTTLLTGVWAKQHHIYFNGDLERGKYNHLYPTLFNTIKLYLPGARVASFTDWEPIARLASYAFYGSDAADVNQTFLYKGLVDLDGYDNQMTDAVIKELDQLHPPTLTFVHYGNPDEAGHVYAFAMDSPEYVQALRQELLRVERLLAVVSELEKQGQHWLVILTTDHGGHAHIHGTPLSEDRAIFAVVYAKDDARYNRGMLAQSRRDQTTFVPTIYDYLNLPAQVYNDLYGPIIVDWANPRL